MKLEKIIDDIEEKSSPVAGPTLEALKEECGMSRIRIKNELFLEDDERIMSLTLEFWWETSVEKKDVIKNYDMILEVLENTFTEKRWYMYEKESRPSFINKDTHLHRLILKKRFKIVTEAEKTE